MDRRWFVILVVGLLLGAAPRDKARVREIIVVGNMYTIESVILRQLPFKPGDVLKYADLKAAERNLARLNVFVVDGERGIHPTVAILDDGNAVNVLVTVQEKEANDPPIKLDTASAREADRKEKQKLAGKWKVASVRSSDRVKELEAFLRKINLTVAPNGTITIFTGPERPCVGSCRLDSTKVPKALDLLSEDSGVVYGIYELKDDTLRICMNTMAQRNRRPADWELKDGAGLVVITLKRDKP